MRKLNFLEPLSKGYDKIDENIIEIKSEVMRLCADIERFFEVNLGIQLTEKTPIVVSDTFIKIFPNLANTTPLQLEQLKTVFCKIRSVNCHLYLNVPISIPDELQEYFNAFPTPPYDISVNGELTAYGMVYVLAFLSQKHQINTFITNCFQNKYFYNFLKRETSAIQTATQRFFHSLCGKGKSNLKFEEPLDKVDVQTFNDTYKTYLIKIFFGIEKCILKWSLSSKREAPFHYLLTKNEPFSKNKKLVTDIVKLRNHCFHGIALFDEITESDKTTVFSIEYFVSIIIRLKKLLTGYEDYEYVLQLITELGEKLVHFYLLRMVEESYKLLDKRLLTEDKVNSKIESLDRLMRRLQSVEPKYFEMATELIGKEEISYFVNASRFSDLYPREMQTKLLKIVKITSDAPIKIGEFTSNHKELCLVFVDVDGENMNAINGVSLLETHLEAEEYYSSKIGICKLTI